jgi:hypothetical protein
MWFLQIHNFPLPFPKQRQIKNKVSRINTPIIVFGLFGCVPFLVFFVWSLRNAVFVFNISSHPFLSETPKLHYIIYYKPKRNLQRRAGNMIMADGTGWI